jgi:hypothetical protein
MERNRRSHCLFGFHGHQRPAARGVDSGGGSNRKTDRTDLEKTGQACEKLYQPSGNDKPWQKRPVMIISPLDAPPSGSSFARHLWHRRVHRLYLIKFSKFCLPLNQIKDSSGPAELKAGSENTYFLKYI